MVPSPRTAPLETLEQILVRLEQTHARLLEEAENKRRAVIEGDLGRLEDIVAREQGIVADVEKDEAARRAAVRAARRALGLPGVDGKLSDLMDAAGEPHAGRLAAVRDRLKTTLNALHQKTRLNQELLKASLEHVTGFLHHLREAGGARTLYNARAAKTQTGGRSLMDTSA